LINFLLFSVQYLGFGPVYAFLEFDDERDAEDALISENGKDMCGNSMVVEYTKDRSEKRNRGGDRYGGGRNGYGGGRGGAPAGRNVECFECGERGLRLFLSLLFGKKNIKLLLFSYYLN
jgi:RNA recognition motif-containing protein